MHNIKACLFDLDGVLVDTAKYHFLAWKRLADELGINFTIEDNEKLKGVSRMTSLDIILNLGNLDLDHERKLELASKKNDWYLEYISEINPKEILPGAEEFLKSAKENGLKIALGSASKNSMRILENLNLVHYFDAIIDGNKVTNAKPDPEVFLNGAAEVNIPPKNCLVFEDAAAGIQAAINAGMYCIGIGSPDVLNKANIVLNGLHEMTLDKLELL